MGVVQGEVCTFFHTCHSVLRLSVDCLAPATLRGPHIIGRLCGRHTTASLLGNKRCPSQNRSRNFASFRHEFNAQSLYPCTQGTRGRSGLESAGLRRSERRKPQRAIRTGTDNQNTTDSVLASCLALLCAGQRPTMPLGEKANLPGDIKNRISDYPRKDSNLQPLAPEANALSN